MIYKLRNTFFAHLAKAVFVIIAFYSFSAKAQETHPEKGWSIKNPFVHDVFIENKGQFNDGVKKNVGNDILYYTKKGNVHIFFQSASITFEHDVLYSADENDNKNSEKEEEDANVRVKPVFMNIHWDGANKNATIEVQEPESAYFTYRNPNDKRGHSSVLAHAWRKIIYHNLYNNIDVAFYYTSDHKGLEYDIIVHPGGDLSQVKMHYSDNADIQLINNSIHISSDCANLNDRAPIASDENGKTVASSFSLNNKIVSFTVGNYDKTKTLTIDPAFTSPTAFTGTNKAYDVQYDLAGNLYAMGSGDKTEYQLEQFNAAGTLVWTWTTTFLAANQLNTGYFYYGGYCTDNRSGSSYISEGLDYNSGTGCYIEKISSAGTLMVSYTGNSSIDEIWKMAFDYCDNQVIIGAGEGTSAVFQGATMDTNCTTINPVNVLGAPANSTHHDIAMITFDGVGKCYFATTKPAQAKYTGYWNVLLQMPSATLAPTAYQVPDRSVFIETASIPYYPALPSGPYIYCGNGFNGLAADLNIVATYDGNYLRTWTPATGAIVDTVQVSPLVQMSGGIALDCQDNIYVGNANKVSVYSKSLSLINTLTLTSTASTDSIYDFHIAPNGILYAGGNGFVSATPITVPKMVTVVSPSTSCGCTGTASATVCDAYPYTYQWSNGQTTSTATGLCPGKVTVTIKDNACIPRIDTASVVVKGGTGTLAVDTTVVNVKCFGETNGSASVTVTGTGPFTYKWSNGITTSSDTGLAAGKYWCVVTETGGCSDSVVMTVIQPALLTLSASTSPATCNTTCDGQANVFAKGGTAPYKYTWSNGGTNANINNMCVGASYTCTITDAHGCTVDTVLSIANPPPIVLTITSTPEQCSKLNGSATVTASGGTPGYTYLWSSGATTSSITGIAADQYCVKITDANKCTADTCVTVGYLSGDTVKIVSSTNVTCNGGNNGSATAKVTAGTPPFTYQWAPSAGVTGATTLTASTLSAGLYTITVTDSNGCKNWAVVNITQPTPVTIKVPPDTICIGQSATLTATASGGTPPYTYLWNNTTPGSTYTVTPTVTTTYTVQATDSNGCPPATANPVVTVRPPLTLIAGPPNSICPGGSATITAKASGGDGIYFYSWAPGGATTTSITVSPAVTTTYTVFVHDGCTTPPVKDSVIITVNPLPVVNLVADTLQGCAPLCVKFTNKSTVTGGTIASSHWTFGDGSTSDSTNPTHCYTKAGVYSVGLTVTTNNGCTDSVMINNYINVYSYPTAAFSYTPQPADIMNPTIYFTDHSTDAYGIINWFWQFGDGTDSTGIIKNPQHTYADTGVYCVSLEVTNKHGCTAQTTQCVYIEPFFVIYVPNAFTPNGNGLNDLFTAKGVGIIKYQMWIFDRWGQQLYYTTDIYGGWNGIVQGGSSGQRAQEDTYVWLIEVTDVFHKDHRYIGRVTLIK